jgi:hypothetical protein
MMALISAELTLWVVASLADAIASRPRTWHPVEDRFTQYLQLHVCLGLDLERTMHKLPGGLDESPKSPQWSVHGSAIAQSTNS